MDITITIGEWVLLPTIVNSLIVVGVLMLFFVVCGVAVKMADPTKSSSGLVLFMEIVYTSLLDFAKGSMGDGASKYFSFLLTMVSYLLVANLLGLTGLMPPTSDYSVTLALTIITLVYIMIAGVKSKGVLRYLKDTYLGDMPFLLPLNVIGEFSKIISLSFRLFGNIMSGALILSIVTSLLGWISAPFLPILNAYFDIFAGGMQTMIFAMLTMMWLKNATE